MSRDKLPVTQAIRVLREHGVAWTDHPYAYEERGGTEVSARELGVPEHQVVKTLIMEDDRRQPMIVLMHGDREVSTKMLARHLGVKSVEPVTPDKASKLTGYLVGGTSPFGTRTKMPVYAEATIFALDRIYINGGKRGFLIEIEPHILKTTLKIEEVSVGIEN